MAMKTTYYGLGNGWVRFQEPGEPISLPSTSMANLIRWPWHLQKIQHEHGESWHLCFETGGVDLKGWTEDDAIELIHQYGSGSWD